MAQCTHCCIDCMLCTLLTLVIKSDLSRLRTRIMRIGKPTRFAASIAVAHPCHCCRISQTDIFICGNEQSTLDTVHIIRLDHDTQIIQGSIYHFPEWISGIHLIHHNNRLHRCPCSYSETGNIVKQAPV